MEHGLPMLPRRSKTKGRSPPDSSPPPRATSSTRSRTPISPPSTPAATGSC
ncbi:unnamed protein product [Ectocarpus sp. CCAP 1310/34]|nr:unnamed protein product [Ectocarpus sp. CCAP 1310/34]